MESAENDHRHARIHLASKSPRRRELLERIGVPYEPVAVDVDEAPRQNESASQLVARLALAKARAGRRIALGPVLGADTAVAIGDAILGKPEGREQALAMLARLSGRRHRVYSAVALAAERESVLVNASVVTFRKISSAEAAAYWTTGEPADKAGAYAIQGRGAIFIRRLEGSYSGVMGLPLFETARLLEWAGINVL